MTALNSGGISIVPAVITGSIEYQGTWNASTNTPALVSGTGTNNYYYIVSVAGATNLDGVTDWAIGDWAIFNGTTVTWQKVDNSNITHTGEVTGGATLTVDPTAISNKTLVTAVAGDMLLIEDLTDGALKRVDASDLISLAASETVSGIAELATQAEVDTGTDDFRIITPLKLATSSLIAANTAKVTNATHTGEVTGATVLTVDPTAISNKTLVTAVTGDMLLIEDLTDGALKRVDASDFLGGGVTLVIETGTTTINCTNACDVAEPDVTAGVCTVNLPAAASHASSSGFLIIKDVAGNAATSGITIDASTTETIDGALTKTITTDYSSFTLYSNGTSWRIV